MQSIKEGEADSARILFLSYGVSVEMLGFAAASGIDLFDEVRRRELPGAVVRPTSGHDGTDAYPGCSCKPCTIWRQRNAQANFIKQEQDADRIHNTGNDGTLADIQRQCGIRSPALHIQQVGRITRVRDSKEADAAQKLFMYFGASAKTLIKNAERGCSFERAQIQQGRFLLIPSDAPVSLSSPLAIQMLMHFYSIPAAFLEGSVSSWPPAQRGIVAGFLNNGVICQRHDGGFKTTDKGALLVEMLNAVLKEGIKNV